MTKVRRSWLLIPVSILLAAGNLPQSRGDTLTVTRKVTRLRSAKRSFAPALADLAEGDRLTLERKEGAWLSVQWQALTGFVHESDVSARQDVRLSGEGVRETYSAAEAAAARKGFNPQVEREYRAGHPDLEAAFRALDAIQGRATDEARVAAFLIEGGLAAEAVR
jgi:hypothetical protein